MPLKADQRIVRRIWPNAGSVFDAISGPAILALPLALIIFFTIKLDYKPYTAKLISFTKTAAYEQINYYADINGDGVNERLLLQNYVTNAAILAYTQENAIIDSWNLIGFWYKSPIFYLNNRNKTTELYSITINSGDSIFVGRTRLKVAEENAIFCYVDKLNRFQDVLNSKIEILGLSDISGDGIEDLIFTIAAGFTLQPRTVYAWDLESNKIIKSPVAGIAYKYNTDLIAFDLNNDNIDELFIGNAAPDNKEDVAYVDTASYLSVFTKDLKYLFNPIIVGHRYSHLSSFPYITENDTLIAAFVWEYASEENEYKIELYSKNGTRLNSKILESYNRLSRILFANHQKVFHTIGESKTMVALLNEQLEYKQTLSLNGGFDYLYNRNIDADSASEYLFYDNLNSTISIVENDLSNYTTLKLSDQQLFIDDISLVKMKSSASIIYVDTSIGGYKIKYQKNPIRNLKIPFFIASYLLSYLIFFLLQKLFVYRSNRRKEMENKMLELQLQSVMNQLNPHFTFNAINTIGDSVLKGKREEAYEFFTKLSELIRSSMTNAFQLDKTLGEEIEFVRQYLEIEAFRFKEKLTYDIDIDPEVNLRIRIPKMLIHIFAENAVKHGIFHRESPGRIQIDIKQNQSNIIIRITDNGIGHKVSKGLRRNTSGKGLLILDSYLSLFGKSRGKEISYTTEELDPGFKYPGTKVIITIPT